MRSKLILFTLCLITNSTLFIICAQSSQENLKIIYDAPRSLCYQNKGQANQCSPPFTNVAEDIEVHSTSTCGEFNKSENICRTWFDALSRKQTHCEVCDSPTKFGTQFLTDRHQMNNETCWISGPVSVGESVNLTLSLGKRFEAYYISIQPCGTIPDSIALYKSSDFGVTWQPWHYFSTDCYRAFKLPTSDEHNAQISLANIQEVLCVALKQADPRNGNRKVSSNVIAFSTTIGRPSTQPWSSSLIDWMTVTDLKISLMRFPNADQRIKHSSSSLFPNQINSYSSTNIFRLKNANSHAENDHVETGASKSITFDMSKNPYNFNNDLLLNNEAQVHELAHFSIADISIGGRCKCNGHANRCVRDKLKDSSINGQLKWGPLRCDCQHNTEGIDCEQCSRGYLDRPWGRATSDNANECKPCQCGNHTSDCLFSAKAFKRSGGLSGGICIACEHNTEGPNCNQCIKGYRRDSKLPMGHRYACRECECNSHSDVCVFSHQIYLMSMKLSGGVCQDCKHNTVGRRCHHCAAGYYRDWAKPNHDLHTCIECQCHPIGSIPNQHCDRKTGQCPCKPGVTGQNCNRCHDGYKQTRIPDTPCVKANEHFAYRLKQRDPKSHPLTRTNPICPPCNSIKRRVKFKKFCRAEAVFQGIVKSRSIYGNLMRLEVNVQDTWRVNGVAEYLLPKDASPNLPPYRVWIKLKDNNREHNRCPCPNLQIGQSYLFIAKSNQLPTGDRMELLLDSNSVILEWQSNWQRRLIKFVRKASRNMCDNEIEDRSRLKDIKQLNLMQPNNYYLNFKSQPNNKSEFNQKMLNFRSKPNMNPVKHYSITGEPLFDLQKRHKTIQKTSPIYDYQDPNNYVNYREV